MREHGILSAASKPFPIEVPRRLCCKNSPPLVKSLDCAQLRSKIDMACCINIMMVFAFPIQVVAAAATVMPRFFS
jgi:hypothetical protein